MAGPPRRAPFAPPTHARGRSPFGPAAPTIGAAALFAAATLVWIAVGDALPGGRWLAVHLFTLGVLTNLVLTFSEHFARTLTRTPGERAAWWPLATNGAIVALLIGRVTGHRLAFALGAVGLLTVVFLAYLRLRHMRRSAVGARFAWIVRVYEGAHGAFVHGAVLGALIGVGVVPGTWYGGFRLAHLHANVLGWGGLTLLATLVFFGPTMARTRIEPGADLRAARALRWGAAATSVAIVALLMSGLDDRAGVVARLVAAGALAVLAVCATVVCVPVARAVVRGRHTAARPLVVGVCVWLPLVVWADVVVVASGSWRMLDAVGLAALTGALAQAVLATLLYLAPVLVGRTVRARELVGDRLASVSRERAWLFNAGVVAVVVGAASTAAPTGVAALGWGVLGVLVVTSIVTAGWPVGTDAREATRS